MVDPELQGRFGPYQILRRVGSGGMGSVFEAHDTCLGRRVALKVLHPHVARRRAAVQRFMREGQAAARIRHPHVVQVLALGVQDEIPYLAMELLEDEDLAQILVREGRLSVARTLDFVLPVVVAVAAAHDAGVIHRDLKPSNICIARGPAEQPWPKVVDFGVSKVLDGADVTATDGVVGTAAYMAPEQARSASNASFRSDQYSLAALLYQCVTGELPFSGSGVYELVESIMSQPLAAPSERAAGIPEALDRAVLRAMSRDPQARFPSLRSFAAALLPMASERTRLALAAETREQGERVPESGYAVVRDVLEPEGAEGQSAAPSKTSTWSTATGANRAMSLDRAERRRPLRERAMWASSVGLAGLTVLVTMVVLTDGTAARGAPGAAAAADLDVPSRPAEASPATSASAEIHESERAPVATASAARTRIPLPLRRSVGPHKASPVQRVIEPLPASAVTLGGNDAPILP